MKLYQWYCAVGWFMAFVGLTISFFDRADTASAAKSFAAAAFWIAVAIYERGAPREGDSNG